MTHEINPKKQYSDLKPQYSFIPASALFGQAVAHTLGARKYGPFNWINQPIEAMCYINAAMGHLLLWASGENNDPLIGPDGSAGSGISHLAHVAANANILIDAQLHGSLVDNRQKSTALSVLYKTYFDNKKGA